jgi:ABC-type Na+ efflux pump permease subunit
MFQTLKLIPPKVWFIDGEILGVLAFGLAGLLWLLLPFFESDQPSHTKRWITEFAVFALVYIVGMSVYGYLAQ